MAKRITFTKDYDHEWPSDGSISLAYTSCKAGVTYTVKDELAAAAINGGYAVEAKGKAPVEVEQPSGE
jgi:hypothetical protein